MFSFSQSILTPSCTSTWLSQFGHLCWIHKCSFEFFLEKMKIYKPYEGFCPGLPCLKYTSLKVFLNIFCLLECGSNLYEIQTKIL